MNKRDVRSFVGAIAELYEQYGMHLEEYGLLVVKPGPGVITVRHLVYTDLDDTIVEEATLSTGPA